MRKELFSSVLYLFLSSLFVITNLAWFLPVRKSLREYVSYLEAGTAEKAKIGIDFFLEEKINDLKIFSRHLRHPLDSAANNFVIQNFSKEKYFNRASLIDKSGNEILKFDRFAPSSLKMENKSGAAEFLEVMKTGRPFFGKIKLSENLEPIVDMGYPVSFTGEEINGIMSAELSIKSATDYIAGVKTDGRGKAYIVDKNGFLIAHSDISLVLKHPDYSSRKIVSDVLSEKTTLVSNDDKYAYVNEEGIKVLAAASYVPETGWAVIFEEPRSEALTVVRNVNILFAAVIFLGLLVTLTLKRVNSKLAEAKNRIREEQSRLKAIISSMSEGLMVVDKNMNIAVLNPGAEKMFGAPAENFLGKNIRSVVKMWKEKTELESDQCPCFRAIKEDKTVEINLEEKIYFQALNGRKFPVAAFSSPLHGDGITGAVVVFRDVSEEKKLEDARINFISVASHQLRTPLTSMRWFSEMLMDGDAGPITQNQLNFVRRVYQGIDRMIALINLLLQLARVEAGRIKITPVSLDIAAVVRGVILTLKANLDSKNQKVNVSTEPNPLPPAFLDQEVVWQTFQNLISNASRYSPENSEIDVKIAHKGAFFECSVADRGIGIPKSQQKRVFEKFFRADNAIKAAPEGSGLGLSLVKYLIEEWRGKIWFESEENKGTIFYFTIPVSGMKAKEGEVSLAV